MASSSNGLWGDGGSPQSRSRSRSGSKPDGASSAQGSTPRSVKAAHVVKAKDKAISGGPTSAGENPTSFATGRVTPEATGSGSCELQRVKAPPPLPRTIQHNKPETANFGGLTPAGGIVPGKIVKQISKASSSRSKANEFRKGNKSDASGTPPMTPPRHRGTDGPGGSSSLTRVPPVG